ncbi:hypothetical protein H8S33_05685 [Ornithinibacillus sp. BX22]|uniref:Uncharacterized protein n=2 Tax=Ornithinibacillus TaxID=484508 RepID=A0A923L4G7_9BACI|nr:MULTISPECIES: hypothetical protein [Ornithinibacillus]MBC5636318.1 hypothetical protein [Ornithinibacillus hominis]MBS3681159.1 hypothetical protein [Ornithinibacillus massiliensis]
MKVILLNGVSGFNGPDPVTDGEYFKKVCYSLIHRLNGNVLSFSEPEAARHYYEVKVNVLEENMSILLNNVYPFIAFASSVDHGYIKFIDNEPLLNGFSPYYRVLRSNELNEPLVIKENKGRIIVGNKNELNEAELNNIKYWKSKTVGDIVFNYWD